MTSTLVRERAGEWSEAKRTPLLREQRGRWFEPGHPIYSLSFLIVLSAWNLLTERCIRTVI